jgi:hypothetical protein
MRESASLPTEVKEVLARFAMPSPIERMIDASMICTKCGTKGIGTCDCWEGKPSRKELIKTEAERIASEVIGHIEDVSRHAARCAKDGSEKPSRVHYQSGHRGAL